ncbi:DNA double-strand break repair nuclease NurA [Calothrix sp. UHCC 0171]|uniref:DNA double-strand break repair nuclease NurA n=1 Tax=Calothrix sp. UHCC 0171 TaxID=3110245 RepID=UPI002B1F1107|nr:hypothetical protein [Calothrix sp. UHCC 0171]MEA5573848.1 hypothetical protein [Calothrix sp. UHCC 0171]
MSLDFFKNYDARRLEEYDHPPSLEDENEELEEGAKEVKLNYELNLEQWKPISLNISDDWSPLNWKERPRCFVDGKDVGETIAWLSAPGGYPVPIRLSQIGSIVVRVENGEFQREFEVVERVVSMAVDLFPWEEVESFAVDLQAHGFRLLSAMPYDKKDGKHKPSYELEKMRKAAENKSNTEMGLLEEAAITQCSDISTIIDGRLEPRKDGFDAANDPVFGVIKTHRKLYLHSQGMQLLYQLEPGERTPVFSINDKDKQQSGGRLPVISWYVRLSGGSTTPDWGYVRVEACLEWFEKRKRDWDFINLLSRTIYEYRCREKSYKRAPISLHPIVRAEEKLGLCFSCRRKLKNNLYHLTGL